ncbi:hypothetical protein P170DRAFT_467047 [Aspergillus steynii IBT 23096]|uniref:Uncharacterized protein n=1 Tax=Aspergillus steynii IBT 23096 TaxID=1392250 RepID=A0A2I2FYY3_9EURO|nr:uncharacterized protein P170DRAFT_467047 [Aspergillus steynii IBT 23096]PLB45844.1 hypothetical protein P170DRAFT_467047 [Aspergillus steynii IBT 23096]
MPPPQPIPPCEFTNPCTTHLEPSSSSSTSTSTPSPSPSPNTTPPHPRKLISHIFGRNKTSTRLVPTHIWPHYCRKHYQRARYRAPNWPVAQVELVRLALDRMEVWGGVRGFQVVLRKRALVHSGSTSSTSAFGGGDGDGDGEGDDGEGEKEKGKGKGKKLSTKRKSKSKGKGKRPQKKRKAPAIHHAPVPDWLRHHLGEGRTFAEVRSMLDQLKGHLQEARRGKELRFPDIEILPALEEWVYAIPTEKR